MKQKKLTLKKVTISNLGPSDLMLIRGGFDLEDYSPEPTNPDPPPPADGSENNC